MVNTFWNNAPARIACAGFFLALGAGNANANDLVSASETSTSSSSGTLYRLPGVDDAQTATGQSATSSNFFGRLANFY